MIKGTSVEKVSQVILKLSRRRRFQVREITLDMAPNMARIARLCFPAAKLVIDRFHVQKLAFEAVQEMRIKARWEALDKEMVEITYAKASGQPLRLKHLRMGTVENSCWLEAAIFVQKTELWSESQRKELKSFPGISRYQEGLLLKHEVRVDISSGTIGRYCLDAFGALV